MLQIKSYYLYNPIKKKYPISIKLNQNRTFFYDTGTIIHPNTSLNTNLSNFPFIQKQNSFLSCKRTKSSKNSLFYKFYKSLKKISSTPKAKYSFYHRDVIDKSAFNFNLKNEDDDILERMKKINKGNKKHKHLYNIAYKKELDKRKTAQNFFKEMKITKMNIRLVKKQKIEEQKIINERNLLNNKKRIRKIRNISFESPMGIKNMCKTNKVSLMPLNKLFENERKLVIKKDQLMHRFHEIMNKIRKNEN